MAFFQQLRLLLWKNWLTVIRQPVWSLILIVWPLIIFIIIAVTRSHFPPLAKDTCYVGPRNLPSTGFFPFLQTLMCNTDSNCHNKSRLLDTKSHKRAGVPRQQSFPKGSPLESLFQGGNFSQIDLPKNFLHDPAILIEVLNKMIGVPHQASPTNGSLSNITLSDQRNLSSLLQSVNKLKRAFCAMTLPLMDTASHDPFTFSMVTFCKTNDTALEVSLLTLNQILTELMTKNTEEMVTTAGMSLLMIAHLQNETVLWESLLAIPQLFSSGSVDQVLATVEGLLISMQGAMNKIESNFPETGASLSTVHSLIAGGINLVDYIQNWPGKDVSILLRDVVTVENGSLGGIMMQVLTDVQIPLDKAIGLTMDKSMVHSYLCDNSSNPFWLSAACSTGTVDMLLGWISPEKVAKQILLAWSRDVALHDLSFAKSLIGGLSPGDSNSTRSRRSVDTLPQNLDEELFLEVGKVVLAIVKLVPEVDLVVQSVLQTGFQSLMTGTMALDTVEEMMDNVLKDATNLQWVYLSLMTNQSLASGWIDRVLYSVLEGVKQTLGSDNLTCNNVLEPFEWLLNTESVDIEVWRSVICQNSSTLEQALLMEWMPLFQKAQEVYDAITSRINATATLPMILSEWHKMQESTMQLDSLLSRLVSELGGAYSMNWMQVNITQDLVGTLQQSVLSFMVDVGEHIETTELWPSVKNYFHTLYWILNYRPGVTPQPVNCSTDFFTSALTCDTGFNWPQFVQTVTQALMSPNQELVVNVLKGTLNFLQQVYGVIYKNQAITFLNDELSQGGDTVSGYLISLLINLDTFLREVSILPNSSLDVMTPAISNLFESAGLGRMLPLLFSDSPVNISTLLDIASKIGRENQHYVNFNESDPTLPELERLIMHFLSMEGNLTIALPHIMGHSLLTYSDYFHPDLVAKVREFIQPFTNKTSTGAVEAILSAVELLKTVTDASDGDPAVIILGYIRQFQELVMSMFRLRRIKQVALPSGQLTAGQVTDLHLLSQDFLKLLTPEVLQNLTQAGPDAAQTIVIQKFVSFLPSEVQHEATRFLNDFKSLQNEMSKCATGQDCLTGISEILHFLDQIFELMLSGNGTVTVTIDATNRFVEGREYEELERVWFSLLLAPKDSAAVQTSRQILHLVKLLMAKPNISVSDVQNALRQSNLTLEELNDFAALAGAANINNLMVNLIEIVNTRICFEPQHDLNVTAQCALSLIRGVSTFLTQVPELRNQTAFLSLIPLIVKATLEDVMKIDFSSQPYVVFVDTLNITLANIKLSLQLNHLNTPEIMNELKVVEHLMQLIANMEPFNNTDSALMQDPMYAQHVSLQIMQWYLNKLENISSNSSISELLQPFFYMTQMQVTSQLAQTNFSMFVSNQVEVLINSLQHPIDGAGVSKIGLTVVQILHHLFDFIKFQLQVQGDNFGSHYMFNTTTLNAVETQIKQYLTLTENWMKQPNVQLVLTNMLQWGNPSINTSAPLTDIQHLLQTMVHFLSDDEQVYLSIISNITHSLKQALMVAEQPGGLQSDHFLDVIFAAVQPLKMLIPLPAPLKQNMMDIVEGSLQFLIQPNMSYDSSRATVLLILNRTESIVQQTVPEMFAVYLLPGLKIVTTYFKSISMISGPDSWNQMILNQMETIQSSLPPNCTAKSYISAVINITQSILMFGQGNMSYDSSLATVLLILNTTESIVQQTVPEMFAVYLLPGLKIVTTYFESISMISGPDSWNQMILNQMKTIQSFLPPNCTAKSYISAVINITQSILMLGQGNMSYDSSRATVLLILDTTESIVQQTVPEMFAVYLLPGLKIVTTYFESISMISGPDSWNQMILNLMETIQSSLPPNCTEKAYISAVINITQSILMSDQGNMSLWASFENGSLENVPMIIGQLGEHVSNVLMGIPELPHSVVKAVKLFAHLPSLLNQMINRQVDEDMWQKPEKMLQALLFSIEGTELWHNISSVVPLFEKIIGVVVKNMQAGNVMIQSLQVPLVTLITDVLVSANSSSVVLSEVMERIQFSTERTVQAAQQANGTLECSKALSLWEPVRQAGGLSSATMYMWCNISLQPVLDAYAEALNVDMTHMGVEPMTANATAARIVKIIWSMYQVTLNQTHVTEELIMAVSDRLSILAGWPLNPEVQHYWYKQLQGVQLQNSLSSINMLSEELLNVAPFLYPHIETVEEALIFIVNNSHLLNSSSSEDLFKHVAMIFLNSANISSADFFSMIQGDFSTLNEAFITDMLRKVVEQVTELKILGEDPMAYRVLERVLMSNDTSLLVKMVTKSFAWLTSTEAFGVDLLMQVLPKMYDILQGVLSLLNKMNVELPANTELFEGLVGNLIAMLRQIVRTSGPLPPMGQHHGMFLPESTYSNHTVRSRHKREALMMPQRDPMDDFTELFAIDYPAMFKALAVPPSTVEIMDTIHVVFANPDLNVVLKGATSDMPWGLNNSQEETINAVLGVLSFVTLPATLEMSSMDLLVNVVHMIPDSFPFSSLLKNITRALASESEENLLLMEETFETIAELFQISETDQTLEENLAKLRAQVCTLEDTELVHLLLWHLSIEPGLLCGTFMPGLQTLFEILITDTSALTEAMFQTFIGEPTTYSVEANWTAALSESLGFNTSSLYTLNINISSPGVVKIGELLRNETAFVLDVHRHMDFDPAVLDLLMNSILPNNNLEILSWLVSLHQCNSTETMGMTDLTILETFCSMSTTEWYSFVLLVVRHVNTEKLIYRVVLSEELQSLATVMLDMAEAVVDVMNKIIPTIGQLQTYLLSMEDLDTDASSEFNLMTRGQTPSKSNHATFVTLSKALCTKGIVAVFGITKLTTASHSSPSSPHNQQREEMIERFKIPRNATPFCMNMYLDMVNTTGGAIAWAFLKPMLMGQILFTPDTPVTRNIMEKANTTLQEFANLRKQSQEWIESSNYIINSAETLSHTLPMLQNSLGNPFVKNFIQMQTDINVDRMKETLKNFSNITVMLENNKQILDHITTLSNLMMDLSSCIQFDRYRGYDSEEQLNTAAQELAKNRNLYASVIFKLPKDKDSSRSRHARASSTTSSLPPKVSYTIRMHMDNVMRTDRVRNPYYVKDTHIVASLTMRYNRGFIYLQENIDRAIIETHAGHRVTEPAVQLQPFPYPCHLRDEYLEAISFVFPIMLMLAWVLFVADFVKKLVHERELRLHEYMKMMGVNPASHFFAWFIECATYLVMTIFILTLVMKYGNILPHSDGFLLFLYFCDYGLSILAFSYLVSSLFDRTYIAGLSGSLLYILSFFPFIVVMALETNLSFSQKSLLGLFSPTCFSHASQYVSRYEAQGQGIHWKNSYTSPIADDTASFGWLCWLMVIDSILYFVIGAYIRMVFPGKYGIPAPWYFPFKSSFWTDLCCSIHSNTGSSKGLLFTNVMQKNQPVLSDNKGKGKNTLSFQAGEDFSELPIGVVLHSLSKIYGDRVAIENLNVSFHEGHVTSLLGHNGAGKTTTMSLLTGLFAPSSGSIEVYGRDMQTNIDDIRKELGVCMQYDVLFDHMTAKEHLLLYGQIKAPHWTRGVLHEQVRTILEETGMYAHRHKRVGTLSGGMKRKLSISIAFIGGSRLVVLDEPTTGVDPCSRRSIWDIVIQHKKHRTIIMSTHHLDEAEVLSDRIAFLEKGGLKCCGSPFYLKDKLGQGYKLTLTKKKQSLESKEIDHAELKEFIQAHVPEARLKETQGGDLVYSLPTFTSSNASSYRSLLTALDTNLNNLQLGGYGVSDTTLEEVFLELTHDNTDSENVPLSISETVSDTQSLDSFSSDSSENLGDKIKLTGSSTVSGMALLWQQIFAMLVKRFKHSHRDWKGLISQILLPVLFVLFAMGLGSIKNDLRHYPEMVLSPALYNIGPSYSFFSNKNPSSRPLVDAMMSFPGIDNACLDKSDNSVCTRSHAWTQRRNTSGLLNTCKCTSQGQVCDKSKDQLSHKKSPSSQDVYNLTGIDVQNYLVNTANDFIRNRYGGFEFGMQLPSDLQMDVIQVPKNRTLSKVWFNPEGHHTMPAYMNSLNNLILRTNLPADKDPTKYAISVSSHPYFGRADDEDAILQGMLQMLVAMCVLTGFSITTASFAIYEVSEHHSGAKRLQHIAGISEPLYWAVNFFYDMAIYLIPVTLTVAVIAAFQIPAFTERQNLGVITLLFVLFGFATFPWMYLLAGIFKDAEMAFITYVCVNLFISVNTIMSTSIFYFMGQISPQNPELIKAMFERMCNAFLIFPQFNFGNGLMQLTRKNIEVQILSGYGIDAYQNPFSTEAFKKMFIASFIQGLVFFTLRLLLNKFLKRKVRLLICGKTLPQVASEHEDEDVTAEHLRVSSGAASSDILQLNQLTKVYQHLNKKVPAVKRLSVGIPAGECFGLLGVNGAGKTTTFKMLTGDVSPTDGTAQIRDWDGQLMDIMECRYKGINIGYCPQVDALDNLLTGEEHLYFYARIRGISKREIDRVVSYLLRRLELNYHRNIITDGYSCGTRRKLSTALALLGHPQILLLDEPSSGMDPRTKRHLWKIISEEVKGKCAVVLTSHSMEECEALCSRLAIMVKGQFRCLGSLQHIKNRFGRGFTVKMYLAGASCDAEAITGFMQRRFPSTYLKDQHSTMVEYHVPVAPGGVADIFDQLESNKTALQIKHFSVSQTTLDEVFINFAMGKIGMDTIPIDDEGDDADSLKTVET
ncbi:ATP-binding cassette sub-family A member 12 [Solea senegalensis]|uniref:ATP-binding cassette sub-family A member 12 n=1 Tax=Solea senegalensis TaxID=28829 RepID=A0AAV6RGP1_SOLSE|nr:ATP-binding cassette sub-family A member 12 [Solea senegalensis]